MRVIFYKGDSLFFFDGVVRITWYVYLPGVLLFNDLGFHYHVARSHYDYFMIKKIKGE